MKKYTLLFAAMMVGLIMNAQMANGKYTFFSGDWQILFVVDGEGKNIPSWELTDMKTGKLKSGKGSWRSIFKPAKNEKGETPSKGTEVTFYELMVEGEIFRFDAPQAGALMLEFPDGKRVGMKERK
ncbi:MAG: hypothetical protein ACKOW8_01520 [Flavobacteriales bacterium]